MSKKEQCEVDLQFEEGDNPKYEKWRKNIKENEKEYHEYCPKSKSNNYIFCPKSIIKKRNVEKVQWINDYFKNYGKKSKKKKKGKKKGKKKSKKKKKKKKSKKSKKKKKKKKSKQIKNRFQPLVLQKGFASVNGTPNHPPHYLKLNLI